MAQAAYHWRDESANSTERETQMKNGAFPAIADGTIRAIGAMHPAALPTYISFYRYLASAMPVVTRSNA